MPVVTIVILVAIGLAACTSVSLTPVPGSATPSARAVAASVPAATASAVTAATPGSAAPSSSGGGLDVCGLVTTSELSKIVGAEVHATTLPSGGWIAGRCAWIGPTSSFFVSVGTATSIRTLADPAVPDAKAKLAAFKQSMSATGSPKDVAGIGDGAVSATTGIAADKAGSYFEVTNLGLSGGQLVEIAKLIAAKL
jgi:hypothetical protein